ncbi:MAG: hypothetical protein HZB26_06025 [Candidatus Hydrogenedentes bacterium]|nr:hypothetical protein [Candidatus Hydrogenedentota bacterium]
MKHAIWKIKISADEPEASVESTGERDDPTSVEAGKVQHSPRDTGSRQVKKEAQTKVLRSCLDIYLF